MHRPAFHCILLSVAASLALCLQATLAGATIPLPPSPDWESNPNGQFGTGLGVADLDRDGWPDLVVANGNDMARQRLAVYRNLGAGVFPANPTWTSQDIDYHGHLDLADVDGDGWMDCAVAVYIGAGGFSTPGRVKLYRGNGDATFSPNPIWESGDRFYCFSVAFGDIDGDGDPDLACATGDDYDNHPERRRVYRNHSGALETAPSWQSTELEFSLDVDWADFNGDGWLDLAFAGTSCPNRIYYNGPGGLATSAGWTSADGSIFANTLATGDYDGDGWLDLAIADNYQLGGSGRFKVYRNQGGGVLTGNPAWQSVQAGYGSHVSWVDIDEDGDLDLASGQWWGPVRVYENLGGALSPNPAFTSATSSVIENEVWEDVDNDGLQEGLDASLVGDGVRRLFYLPERPARELLSITVNGVGVDPGSVYLDSDAGWFVLPDPPAYGAQIWTVYTSSSDLDLALSNWDSGKGEYLFRNTRNPAAVAEADLAAVRLSAAPNPSSGPVRLSLEGGAAAGAGLALYDLSGRRVRWLPPAGSSWTWDGTDAGGRPLPAGVYLARWSDSPHQRAVTKVIRR